jgi:hypothetical protein
MRAMAGSAASFTTAIKLCRMAEAASSENVPARLAQVRDGLKLLADYL